MNSPDFLPWLEFSILYHNCGQAVRVLTVSNRQTVWNASTTGFSSELTSSATKFYKKMESSDYRRSGFFRLCIMAATSPLGILLKAGAALSAQARRAWLCSNR